MRHATADAGGRRCGAPRRGRAAAARRDRRGGGTVLGRLGLRRDLDEGDRPRGGGRPRPPPLLLRVQGRPAARGGRASSTASWRRRLDGRRCAGVDDPLERLIAGAGRGRRPLRPGAASSGGPLPRPLPPQPVQPGDPAPLPGAPGRRSSQASRPRCGGPGTAARLHPGAAPRTSPAPSPPPSRDAALAALVGSRDPAARFQALKVMLLSLVVAPPTSPPGRSHRVARLARLLRPR